MAPRMFCRPPCMKVFPMTKQALCLRHKRTFLCQWTIECEKNFMGKTILRIRWWFDRRGCGSRFLLETVLDNLPPSDSESMVEPVNMMFGNNITFSGPTSYSSEHLKKKVRNHHVLERNTVTSCNDILRCWSRTSSPPIYFWHVT